MDTLQVILETTQSSMVASVLTLTGIITISIVILVWSKKWN